MAVSVKVSVSKSAGPEVHADARAHGDRVVQALKALEGEAAQLGIVEIAVKLKHAPAARPVPPVAKAAEPIAWPRDLASEWP